MYPRFHQHSDQKREVSPGWLPSLLKPSISNHLDATFHWEIFIAAPSSLSALRMETEAIVHRQGTARRQVHPYGYFEIPPGFANGDPQALINRHLRRTDICIALLNSHPGTPTPRAASGTLDEIQHVTEQIRYGSSSELMIYFIGQLPKTDGSEKSRYDRELLALSHIHLIQEVTEDEFRARLPADLDAVLTRLESRERIKDVSALSIGILFGIMLTVLFDSGLM